MYSVFESQCSELLLRLQMLGTHSGNVITSGWNLFKIKQKYNNN